MEPSLPARFRPEAQLELQSASLWYARFGEPARVRFLSRIENALLLIREFPDGWPRTPTGDARRINVSQTPYSLIYRADASGILVLAVIHGNRKPGYWVDRT